MVTTNHKMNLLILWLYYSSSTLMWLWIIYWRWLLAMGIFNKWPHSNRKSQQFWLCFLLHCQFFSWFTLIEELLLKNKKTDMTSSRFLKSVDSMRESLYSLPFELYIWRYFSVNTFWEGGDLAQKMLMYSASERER